MKVVERYNALSTEAKNLVILIIIGVFGTLVCIPLALLPEVGLGGPLGFLLGSILELFSYWTICRATAMLLSKERSKPGSTAFVVVCYFLRLALIGGALVLASFCTFRWKAPYLYVWTVFAALLPVYPVLIINTLLNIKKGKSRGEE